MFKDILLPISSHPEPVSRQALKQALGYAALFDAHVTGLVEERTIVAPIVRRPFSGELERQFEDLRAEAQRVAQGLLAAFEEEAAGAGLSHEGRIARPSIGSASDPVVDLARTRDLTIVPLDAGEESGVELVQDLVFESGRPVLMVPEASRKAAKPERAIVAWDFGRPAARAVSDALPLLRLAGEVEVLVVTQDEVPATVSGDELLARLARNGVKATLKEVDRGGRGVGEVIGSAAEGADLLVMGAFGHSRLRDFILGGATRHVLKAPSLPTLLSH